MSLISASLTMSVFFAFCREMLSKYRKEMALRKKLHNELVDLKVSF